MGVDCVGYCVAYCFWCCIAMVSTLLISSSVLTLSVSGRIMFDDTTLYHSYVYIYILFIF